MDTKADKTDVNNRLDDLRNRCFKLGGNGEIMTPIGTGVYTFNKPIQQLNNNEKYSYGDINADLPESDESYIYDKTIDTFIKVIEYEYFSFDQTNTFFKTDKSLDLNHTFYLDDEQTGIVENLTQLNIEASNVFVNLPYVEVNNNLDEYEESQYIYDATDNKWIKVVKCYSLEYGCVFFNTELPLDLNDDLYYSYTSTFTTEWSISNGENAISIGYDSASNGRNAIAIGCGSASNGENAIAIGYDTNINADSSIAIGCYISTNYYNSTALGYNIRNCREDSIAIGENISNAFNNAIAIGCNIHDTKKYSVAIGYNSQSNFTDSLSLGTNSKAGGDYAIALGSNVSNTKSIFGVGFDGVNGIDMDRDNYGLYLKGFGGYDGTNLVVKNGGTETLNPNIKSVQQIINEKADASAIPTKVSQLTNDANFITSYTETDPVWTREKTNYYTKTEIDNKGYLTQHQPLDNYVTKSTADANYLSLANGGDIKNEVTISKANATNDDYTLHLGNDGLYIGQDNGFYSIVSINPSNFTYNDFVFYVDENQFSFSTCFNVRRNDKNNGGENTIQLGKVSITESSLSRLNLALDNITAASTAEEVVTKFNALLADLKNKGLMEADE